MRWTAPIRSRGKEEETGLLPQRRPAAAMAVAPNLAGNGGFPFLNHETTQNLLKSDEKLNPISSTQFMNTTMSRGESASRGWTAVPLPAAVNSNLAVKCAKIQKKNMGRERRRRQAHQREEERLNSTSKPR
jgi:hypothetical protein